MTPNVFWLAFAAGLTAISVATFALLWRYEFRRAVAAEAQVRTERGARRRAEEHLAVLSTAAKQVIAAGHLDPGAGLDVELLQGQAHSALADALHCLDTQGVTR